MTKYIIAALVIAYIAICLTMFTKDQGRQCDGKTKTFASLGKMYSCQNFKGVN